MNINPSAELESILRAWLRSHFADRRMAPEELKKCIEIVGPVAGCLLGELAQAIHKSDPDAALLEAHPLTQSFSSELAGTAQRYIRQFQISSRSTE